MIAFKGKKLSDKKFLLLFWLIFNLSVDAICYNNAFFYRVVIITFIYSSLLFCTTLIQKAKSAPYLFGFIIVVIIFFYIWSMNTVTSIRVPYWGIFYPVLLGISSYVEKKYKLEGTKKFWLHFAKHTVNFTAVVIYSIYFTR